MWLNSIDEGGFFVSQVNGRLLSDEADLALLVEEPLPVDALTPGMGWRWTGDAWTQAVRPRPDGYEPIAPAQVRPSVQRTSISSAEEQIDILWRAMDRGEIPMAPDFYQAVSRTMASRARAEVIFEVGKMPEA